MNDPKRLAAATGIVAPLVGYAAILVSTALNPEFSWTTRSLSFLGMEGGPTFLLFNGGLMAAAVVGTPFVVVLWDVSGSHLERAGTAMYALALVAMGLVGVFPLPSPGGQHFVVAVVHFLSYTVGLLLFGAGLYRAGHRRRGLVTAGLGAFHAAEWVVLLTAFSPDPLSGIAIPEMIGSLVWGGWMIWMATEYLTGGSASEVESTLDGVG